MSKHPTISEHLKASGVSRRSFLQLCATLMATAPVGLALTGKKSILQMATAIGKTKRPSVIWLHFQDCTGCTETLLRTSAPDVAHLILDVFVQAVTHDGVGLSATDLHQYPRPRRALSDLRETRARTMRWSRYSSIYFIVRAELLSELP